MSTNVAQAQFFRLSDYTITTGSYLGLTDLSASPGAGLRFNIRNDFFDRFSTDLEFGATYLQGNGWSSMVIPVGMRYKYVPKSVMGNRNAKFTPFATVGASALYFNNLQLSDSLNLGLTGQRTDLSLVDMSLSKANGVAFNIPIRAGMIYRKSDFMDLELSVGYDLVLSDALDYAESGQYDSMVSASFGVNFKNRGNKRKDSDGDGIPNYKEKELGLDPMNPDSDSDGLLDGEEINKYATDPMNPDTDGDGLMDGNEVMVFFTDPLVPDTDMDGMNDYMEVNMGRDPLKNDDLVKETEPEQEPGLNQNQMNRTAQTTKSIDQPDQTLFFEQDTKTLSATELAELRKLAEASILNTNKKIFLAGHADLSGKVKSPIYNAELAADRAKSVKAELIKMGVDSDRIVIKSYGFDKQKEAAEALKEQHQLFRKVDVLLLDSEEELQQVLAGDNAPQAQLANNFAQLAPGNSLATLYFRYGSTDLDPTSQDAMNQIANFLIKQPNAQIRIEGHTDAVGPSNVNQQVSLQRANAIKSRMVSMGVNSGQIQTQGFGESKPLMLNDTEAGRARNRRIEIIRIR